MIFVWNLIKIIVQKKKYAFLSDALHSPTIPCLMSNRSLKTWMAAQWDTVCHPEGIYISLITVIISLVFRITAVVWDLNLNSVDSLKESTAEKHVTTALASHHQSTNTTVMSPADCPNLTLNWHKPTYLWVKRTAVCTVTQGELGTVAQGEVGGTKLGWGVTFSSQGRSRSPWNGKWKTQFKTSKNKKTILIITEYFPAE